MLPAKSNMLANQLPKKWQPKYVLKRIGDEDINIGWETRNEILEQLARGGKYVQIGEYTIMLNSIKSIDPKWGSKNIPPRPPEEISTGSEIDSGTNTLKVNVMHNPEYDEWVKYFGGDK